MSSKTILHLTCDYPDPLAPRKTRAFFNLVEGTAGYRHIVYSLNRVGWRSAIATLEFAPDRIAVAYGAPPKGLFLQKCLDRVADWMLLDLDRRGVRPDIVHAHKFAVEGLIGDRLSKHFDAPLLCGVHGNTDVKFIRVRRDLINVWRRIANESAVLLPCAPWSRDALCRALRVDPKRTSLLPVISATDRFSRSSVVSQRLVSIFNLNIFREKNAPALIRAVMELKRTFEDLHLDIYGAGAPKSFLEMSELIKAAGATGTVTLKGSIDNAAVHEMLNGYSGFVMPTLTESFGMVFVEALFAGIPVLHSAGLGIDGYLPNNEIGYACDPTASDDIVAGIRHVLENQATLKDSIAALHAMGKFDFLTRDRILQSYRSILESM